MAKRVPNWTLNEFEIVLQHPDLSHAEIAAMLPAYRTEGSVSWVRGGVHRFHAGQDNRGILSKMMRAHLRDKTYTVECAQCGARF